MHIFFQVTLPLMTIGMWYNSYYLRTWQPKLKFWTKHFVSLHTNSLGESLESFCSPLIYWQLVGLTGLFNLSRATSLGKVNSEFYSLMTKVDGQALKDFIYIYYFIWIFSPQPEYLEIKRKGIFQGYFFDKI